MFMFNRVLHNAEDPSLPWADQDDREAFLTKQILGRKPKMSFWSDSEESSQCDQCA
ncbi:MAG: hypothetical protein JWR67_481 [Mucilaginibacter sp.]|nr:hypothetical protein [Mucilaginibacter sp.]